MRKKVPDQKIATAAVRVAKELWHRGCYVYEFGRTLHSASIYVKAKINGRKFTVRIADHHGKQYKNRPYYIVRVDDPNAGTRGCLGQFIEQVLHADA